MGSYVLYKPCIGLWIDEDITWAEKSSLLKNRKGLILKQSSGYYSLRIVSNMMPKDGHTLHHWEFTCSQRG